MTACPGVLFKLEKLCNIIAQGEGEIQTEVSTIITGTIKILVCVIHVTWKVRGCSEEVLVRNGFETAC